MPTRTIGDATIDWRESGAGDSVLLLLHAFPMHSGMWEPQLTAFPGWRVIAPDARGFGGSRPAPDLLGMDVIAGDAAALLDALGVKRAVVAGLSMGGYAAFELWRRRKDLVRALVLADTRAGADTGEGRTNREAFAKSALERGIGWVADEMAPKLQKRERVHAADAAIRKLILEGSPAAVAAAQRGMARRPDSTPALATLDVPVLILVGAEDGLTPPAEARAMHEAIRASTLVEIPAAGHLSNLENPGEFNAALARFLGSLRRG